MDDPIHLQISIRFESDFHVGNGYGIPSVVDSGTFKDEKGRLMIPGTTIKGVIRDACERIAILSRFDVCNGEIRKGLCGVTHRVGRSPCYICNIFGNPGHEAKFWFGSAHYAPKVMKVLVDERLAPLILPQQSRSEAHNRIDRELGRAEEDFLFSYELGSRKANLQAEIKEISPLVSMEREAHLIFLLAGIRMVQRIGGKRRAGRGRCRLEVGFLMPIDKSVDQLLDRFKEVAS